MEIENTPIYDEVQKIFAEGETTANMGWSAIIHYGEDQTYEPLQVISVNYVRDYVSSFTDEITCTLMIPLGVYSRRIYPNRRDLQITLTRIPLDEVQNEVQLDDPIESERFSAILIDGDRSPTVGQGSEVNDEGTLDLTQLLDVNFQLYDKNLEQIRTMLTGGVYRSTNVQDAITTILTSSSEDVVVDGERSITGVDMVDADNEDKKGQIVIPQGTKLIDVPDFIQSRFGVYNSGLGNYVQGKFWHVYPLYDTSMFNERYCTLTILILPKRKYSNVERTFRIKDQALTILVTGETGFKDDSGTNYVNHGNGVRFADANTIMADMGAAEDNKIKIDRSKNNSEFVSGKAIGGVNNAPISPKRITSNPFVIFSDLAARNGGMFKVVWENSDSSYIVPGMAAKVIYSDESEIQTIYGVVHNATTVSHRYSGFGSKRFKNQTALTLFMNSQVVPIET